MDCKYHTINFTAGAHFGFEVTSLQTGNSSRQLLEGEAAEVCVLLLDPEELTTYMQMMVELSEGELAIIIQLTVQELRGW